jgi:polyadenylate-binding protein
MVRSQTKPEYDKDANVHIQSIEKSVTQQEIFNLFNIDEARGTILSCKLKTSNDGKSLSQAFVQYNNKDVAQEAITRLNGFELKGKKIEVHLLNPKEASSPVAAGEEEKKETTKPKNKLIQKEKSNLFVGNLPTGTDDAGLRKLFAGFEKIQSAVVKKDD